MADPALPILALEDTVLAEEVVTGMEDLEEEDTVVTEDIGVEEVTVAVVDVENTLVVEDTEVVVVDVVEEELAAVEEAEETMGLLGRP